MFLSYPSALRAFLPTGPYFLFKEKHIGLLRAAIFYAFEFISFFMIVISDESQKKELLGLVLFCSGLICLAFLPNINLVFTLRSGGNSSIFIGKIILCSAAILIYIIFILVNNRYIFSSNILFLMYVFGFLIFICFCAFTAFFLPNN